MPDAAADKLELLKPALGMLPALTTLATQKMQYSAVLFAPYRVMFIC
jgi:hypothetical protein